MSGLRSGTLQVVATVVLAAYVGLGGLGYDIIQGLELRRIDQTLGGAIVVVALALVIDLAFALLQRLVVPRGVNAARSTNDRAVRSKRRPVVDPSTV